MCFTTDRPESDLCDNYMNTGLVIEKVKIVVKYLPYD